MTSRVALVLLAVIILAEVVWIAVILSAINRMLSVGP